MGFGKNLKKELQNQNKSVYWLANETGIPKTTLYSIIKKDTTPKMVTAKKISSAIGVDFYVLQGVPFVRKALDQQNTQRENEALTLLRKLTPTEQSHIIDIIKTVIKIKEYNQRKK